MRAGEYIGGCKVGVGVETYVEEMEGVVFNFLTFLLLSRRHHLPDVGQGVPHWLFAKTPKSRRRLEKQCSGTWTDMSI